MKRLRERLALWLAPWLTPDEPMTTTLWVDKTGTTHRYPTWGDINYSVTNVR